MASGSSHISVLIKDQIRFLFDQAYTANIAILATGILVLVAFLYEGESDYIVWFFSLLVVIIGLRLLLARLFFSSEKQDFQKHANYYVIVTMLLGINWAYLTVYYFDLKNDELRLFLTIVNLGLITAAVGSLAVWMKAYLALTLPLIAGLMLMYVLNDSIYAALALLLFSIFMIKVALSSNTNFKQGRLLIEQNSQYIKKMDIEIKDRKSAQLSLEQYQLELENVVKERTKELMDINDDLEAQIERRREVEQELEYLAYYDVLTGLPNRSLLIERIRQATMKAKRNDSLFALLFVDLDRFKSINDSLGHDFGDQLIKEVAQRIKSLLRESDTVARNGGDEFVILIENLKQVRQAFNIAEKTIKKLSKHFLIAGHDVHIGASIGISMYPLDSVDEMELLKMADTAMYCAKALGSNQFEFYSNEMSQQIRDRLELENALRQALKNNEFYMVYQPQVNAQNNQTSGFEALLRWNSPELGMVSPAKFIPVLEETGMIYPVGEWVISDVFKFIKSGKAKQTKVSINLSALQCAVSRFSEKIRQHIDDSGINPKQIEFEVTESLLINDFRKTEKFLTEINRLGCTIALDDFGTGYTSFSYLAKLPIDVIKIDRSLVAGIDKNKTLQDIVRAIVTMSQSLGIENVFEGVETPKELAIVKQLQGKIIQGYLFSKPLDVDDIENWSFEDKRLVN
ncbi:MAG: EAL domain-containing protein [Gammaproteobacteria bacterium]|nr:EAL domain-containing protein [Gammaproteobacteria bacterium]